MEKLSKGIDSIALQPQKDSKKTAPKKKAKKKVKKVQVADTTRNTTFKIKDITESQKAASLITDLVNCYTSDLKLPEIHLKRLKHKLYVKTASVISSALNECVEKIFIQLLQTDYCKELRSKSQSNKKDASSQTDISYDNFLEFDDTEESCDTFFYEVKKN